MKTLRWLTFIPLAVLTIALAQLATGLIMEYTPWWVGLLIVLSLGLVVPLATVLPVRWSPSVKAGGFIILSLFLLLEMAALFSQFGEMSTSERVGRILTDLYLVVGCVFPMIAEDREDLI